MHSARDVCEALALMLKEVIFSEKVCSCSADTKLVLLYSGCWHCFIQHTLVGFGGFGDHLGVKLELSRFLLTCLMHG